MSLEKERGGVYKEKRAAHLPALAPTRAFESRVIARRNGFTRPVGQRHVEIVLFGPTNLTASARFSRSKTQNVRPRVTEVTDARIRPPPGDVGVATCGAAAASLVEPTGRS